MNKKRLIVPEEYKMKKTEWEVWYMMKNHYVWHKENSCNTYEVAYKLALRLEKDCDCFTEIRKIEKTIHVYRFWKEYSED